MIAKRKSILPTAVQIRRRRNKLPGRAMLPMGQTFDILNQKIVQGIWEKIFFKKLL
jgi:hypothetical protein